MDKVHARHCHAGIAFSVRAPQGCARPLNSGVSAHYHCRRMLMRLLVLVALVLAIPRLQAADDPKHAAALSLHQAMMSVDTPALVDSVVTAILKRTGEELPPEVRAEIKALVTEIVTSDEYAQGKAQTYAAMFTLEELQQLRVMATSPIYRKYQSVLPQLTRESSKRLNELIASKESLIDRRLEQAFDRLDAR
jgi:hypothetical protein